MLNGKTALITGAYGGLGQEIAKVLASAGCNLILTGKNISKLQSLSKTLSCESRCVVADLTKDPDISNLTDEDVDILINNAGTFPIKSIASSSNLDFDNCFDVNVRAPFILCRDLGKKMCKRGWGRIVCIGSSSSYNGSSETGIYCASKHALLGLSRSLFKEYNKDGVRTYIISPGSIQTPMGANDTRQDYTTFINPKEIAEYIHFIVSYDNEMISEEIRLNRCVIR